MKDPPQRYSHLGVRRTGRFSILYVSKSQAAGQQIFEPVVFLDFFWFIPREILLLIFLLLLILSSLVNF